MQQVRALIPAIRSLLRGMLISFAVYGLLVSTVVGYLSLGSPAPAWEMLRNVARDWFPWAIATPFIFLLVWRLPIDGSTRWRYSVPVHILSALVILGLITCTMEGGGGSPGRGNQGPQQPRLITIPTRVPPPPNTEAVFQLLYQWNIRLGVYPVRSRNQRPGPPMPMAPVHPVLISLFMIGLRFPVYLAIVSVAHAFYFFEKARDRERHSLSLEAGIARARLEALRMQLQPHFLFNSLNAIAELVHKDPDKADEMLVALSDLLRATLEKTDRQEIPLQQELEFVDRYLAMQKVRLAERLAIHRDIAPETRRALVPVFILQPIVENSLRHGLEPLPGGGSLSLQSSVHAGEDGQPRLRIAVVDTGPGLPENKPHREGIGLSNTRARLRELYGADGQLRLLSRNGLTVEIEVPYQIEPEPVSAASAAVPAAGDPLAVTSLRRAEAQ